MGRIVVSEFVSLDGVVEDPGGSEDFRHGGWSFKSPAPDSETYKWEELQAADVQLMGRVTYDGFAAAWPSMEEVTGEFGKRMNNMPKVVVSTTLTEASWRNSTIISTDVANQVTKLKEAYDGDILVAGSGKLAEFLRIHDLVDEYRLMVYPIVLGQGKRLFRDPAVVTTLELVETWPVGARAG